MSLSPEPWPDRLPDDMPACLARAALMTARSLARAYNAALRDLGVPITQVSLLVAIRRQAWPTLTDLAEAMAMERTTLLRNLRQLETDGLVEPAAARGRSRRFRVTAAGEDVLARAYPVWAGVQRSLQAAMGPQETRDALATLKRLRSTAATVAGSLEEGSTPDTETRP
jgi:DNA-binding MarR family transcriptional regulator